MKISQPKSAADLVQNLKNLGIAAELNGFENFSPTHIRDLEHADEGCLTFYIGDDPERIGHLQNCCLFCKPELPSVAKTLTLIKTPDPKLAFYIVCQDFAPPPSKASIHNTCVIDASAKIYPRVSIGAYCVLEQCIIREGARIHPHVMIYSRTEIGRDVVVEANTSIGATGQVWAWGADGKWWIMPQFGGTKIGDECFIGSNVTIVRGAIQDTVIGEKCRIAHGTRIGHNCQIGAETFISNGVVIPGSVHIGSLCFLGAGSVFRPGVQLADKITVGAGAVVTKSYLEEGTVLAGVPALPIKRMAKGTFLAGVPKQPS